MLNIRRTVCWSCLLAWIVFPAVFWSLVGYLLT